ncbi:unnamed protein product [Trichogramma brassicae]|uniref:Uncharacterized protein n=1 Tax=Trichogramma brassicae TaxID=86971 RepID=A0A6H5I5J1_9HYME|nr:unnamed protein product [Trichogramma brassicae]
MMRHADECAREGQSERYTRWWRQQQRRRKSNRDGSKHGSSSRSDVGGAQQHTHTRETFIEPPPSPRTCCTPPPPREHRSYNSRLSDSPPISARKALSKNRSLRYSKKTKLTLSTLKGFGGNSPLKSKNCECFSLCAINDIERCVLVILYVRICVLRQMSKFNQSPYRGRAIPN